MRGKEERQEDTYSEDGGVKKIVLKRKKIKRMTRTVMRRRMWKIATGHNEVVGMGADEKDEKDSGKEDY
jgi:hypothetical protein